MANYGYNDEIEGWDEDLKHDLAAALAEEFDITIGFQSEKSYIEVDGLYRGVRIRKLKHLWSKMTDEEFVKRADAVFWSVMGEHVEVDTEDVEPGDEGTPDESDAENGAEDDSEDADDADDEEEADAPEEEDPYATPSLTDDAEK